METLKVSVELYASYKRFSRHRLCVLLYFRLIRFLLLHLPSKAIHFDTKNKEIIKRFQTRVGGMGRPQNEQICLSQNTDFYVTVSKTTDLIFAGAVDL